MEENNILDVNQMAHSLNKKPSLTKGDIIGVQNGLVEVLKQLAEIKEEIKKLSKPKKTTKKEVETNGN